MAHTITVYRAPLLEHSGSAPALVELPSAVVQAGDGEDLLVALNRALASIHDHGGEGVPASGPLVGGRPVWLAFVEAAQDPAMSRRWAAQEYYFGVDPVGRLLVQDWFSLAMTVGDLRRAGESGYLPGEWSQVVVLTPDGVGGGEVFSEFVEFLQAVGFEAAIGVTGTVATTLGRAARRKFSDRRARRVVARWHEQGLEGPWVLTKWVDTKMAWDPAEVAKRLGLTGKEAVSLLEAMGYERSERLGMWSVGTSKKSVKQRQRWDENAQDEWQRPRRR